MLGQDLPLIDDQVTVEHLLSHRSGIGDYLDEDALGDVNDYVLTVPPHELTTTDKYLPMLDHRPQKFQPGAGFLYCNSGYVVLALLAERASGRGFHDLVSQLVCRPAAMNDTEFLRSDQLPARTALGYLGVKGLQTNVFHLPVIGSGDGGAYSTHSDIDKLWEAFLGGRIVSNSWVAEMLRPRSEIHDKSRRYGLGFWLAESGERVILEGFDAGVSFRTVNDPSTGIRYTVLGNTSQGAWPLTRILDEHLSQR